MNLIGLSREELQHEIESLGEKPFRAKQLWHWIYWQGKTDFAEMTSLGKPLRQKLIDNGYFPAPPASRARADRFGFDAQMAVPV